MQDLDIVYTHSVTIEPNFQRNNQYEFSKTEGLKTYIGKIEDNYDYMLDDHYYYLEVKKLKEVIVRDFKRVLDYILPTKKNNAELRKEIEELIETYNNDIDYTSIDNCADITPHYNFIYLDSNYLCFNNIENYIDIDECLGSEDYIYETTVIVNRSFTKFYFIKQAINVLYKDDNKKIEVEVFDISSEKVKSNFIKFNKNLELDSFLKVKQFLKI